MPQNRLTRIGEPFLMSKTELARRANVFLLTVDRIEKGMPCRMETKGKILLTLGKVYSKRGEVFLGDELR